MKEPGIIQIYTGEGKGKSTAAFGLALRAAGWKMHTGIVQFMKKGEGYGEITAFANLPYIEIFSFGSNKFLKKDAPQEEEDLALAHAAMAKAKELMVDQKVDILILDELCNAIYFDLVSEKEVLALMSLKRADQEVVITGRNAPHCLLELADLVTEMKEIKHPYQKGIQARRGIEY